MSIRILLADDHQMVRDGLRAILEAEPSLEVVGEASDGREAVELARRTQPDIVVMDVGMTGMNGIEATRQIRALGAARVVALSTYSDKRYVLNMLEAGAAGYVLKASAFDELVRAIRAISQGKNYLSPDITEVVVESCMKPEPLDAGSAYSVLGAREREVLQLIAEGKTSPAIGRELSISTKTVEAHRRNIMRKLDRHSIADLTKYAVREGLTSLEG